MKNKNLIIVACFVFLISSCGKDTPVSSQIGKNQGSRNPPIGAPTPTPTYPPQTTDGFVAPNLDVRFESVNHDVAFYQDTENKNLYWYLPIEMNPVPNNDGNYAKPVVRDFYFYFPYVGASVASYESLKSFSQSRNIPLTNLKEIIIDSVGEHICNFESDFIKISMPEGFPRFHENYPITVTSNHQRSIEMLRDKVYVKGGLVCYKRVFISGLRQNTPSTRHEYVAINILSMPAN